MSANRYKRPVCGKQTGCARVGTMDPLEQAISHFGSAGKLAAAIRVKGQTLHHWRKRGMPRTEWTGETDYAKRIERATKRAVRAKDLLAARVAA